MQWKRMGVIALSVILVAAPASAIPVTDPAAIAQRITMLANQVSIITNQLTQIQQFSDKLTEMRDQVQHLKDKALGAYHALASPFSNLISAKTELVGTGMSWIGEFQGTAAQLANTYKELSDGVSVRRGWDGLLRTADTVTETDLVNIFANLPAGVGSRAGELFRQQRESADRRRVLDHALADASSTLIESLKEAQEALDRVRNQTEKSDTALAQAQHHGHRHSGRVDDGPGAAPGLPERPRCRARAMSGELARRQELKRWGCCSSPVRAGLPRGSERNCRPAGHRRPRSPVHDPSSLPVALRARE